MNRLMTAILVLIFSAFSLVPVAAIAADNSAPEKLTELYNNTVFPLWEAEKIRNLSAQSVISQLKG